MPKITKTRQNLSIHNDSIVYLDFEKKSMHRLISKGGNSLDVRTTKQSGSIKKSTLIPLERTN